MPKNTQKIIGWIVSVLLLAAFLFYAHRVYGGSSSVSDVSLMIVTCVAGIQVVALCCMEDYGAALLEKLAKIEAYHATVSSASTSLNYTYAGVESPVESQRERLRREHEHTLVRGAANALENHPTNATDMAIWIKTFLRGLGYGDSKMSGSTAQQPAAAAAQGDTTQTKGLSFGLAIAALKEGKRVARAGWNGKGMFVYLVPPASYPVQTGAAKAHFGEGAMVPYNAYMAIKNVDETVSTWVPSVNDCLAEDWEVVG